MKKLFYLHVCMPVAVVLNLLNTNTVSAQYKLFVSLKLDHINIAVKDIEVAKQVFHENLGFSIKPGRLHANSILNAFAKFEDGTLLELITAEKPDDELASLYVEFVKKREGAVFYSVQTESSVSLVDHFTKNGIRFSDSGEGNGVFRTISFDYDQPVGNLFFIDYQGNTVRDKPEHVQHKNTAESLVAVRIVVNDLSATLAEYEKLGFQFEASEISDNDFGASGKLMSFENSNVYVLEPSVRNSLASKFLSTHGEGIIGVTVIVRSLDVAKQYIESSTGSVFPIKESNINSGRSILLPPKWTFGVWIELLER